MKNSLTDKRFQILLAILAALAVASIYAGCSKKSSNSSGTVNVSIQKVS